MTRIAVFLAIPALVLGGCAFMEQSNGAAPEDSGAVTSPDESGGPVASSPDASEAPTTLRSSSPGTTRGSEPAASPGMAATPGTASPTTTFSAEPLRPKSSPGVVSGTLGFDTIEGGCAYLEREDGTRYQVIYPEGWRIDGSTGNLLGPGGEMASPGAVVSVRGSIVTDIASICQVGPIFRATEVISVGG